VVGVGEAARAASSLQIDDLRRSYIFDPAELATLTGLFGRTAFVVCHKNEHVQTLVGVLRHLPTESSIVVVTNCPAPQFAELRSLLSGLLPRHQTVFLVHQKDRAIARFFGDRGVTGILGQDDLVRNGKGEAMYIGALCAVLLESTGGVVFYDADNHMPSSLLEYTFGIAAELAKTNSAASDGAEILHNIRLAWASKVDFREPLPDRQVMGRCTAVVSPLVTAIVESLFGAVSAPIRSTNAGEQAMSWDAVTALQFSSGFSNETFQLLELLFASVSPNGRPRRVILQQFHSVNPHVHTKRNNEHIRNLVAQSLGGILAFHDRLPSSALLAVESVTKRYGLDAIEPTVYPSIKSLAPGTHSFSVRAYQLTTAFATANRA
jgi:mannosyl-3-phosphoglycerate synthase